MTTRILVAGASGRMGRAILDTIFSDPHGDVAGAWDRPGVPQIGKDIGEYCGRDPIGIAITHSLKAALGDATSGGHPPHAIIDFTVSTASVENAAFAATHQIPLVIGTTGFTEAQKGEIAAAATHIPIVMAPNMSVGANTLFKLSEAAPRLLDGGYDIEVIEAHHRLKKDAPSGTAVRMAEILAAATGRSYPGDAVFHREGMIGPRSDREIGMQTIRGGDIVGEHTAMFCGIGERLEITHIATSRTTFAQGALRAAKWLQGKAPGLYDMRDVLGLR